MALFKLIAPLGKAVGLLPQLDIMTTAELVDSLAGAGFVIEQQWQPGKGKAVFIVARAGTASTARPATSAEQAAS